MSRKRGPPGLDKANAVINAGNPADLRVSFED